LMSIFAEIISDGAISLRSYGAFWEPVKATPTNPKPPRNTIIPRSMPDAYSHGRASPRRLARHGVADQSARSFTWAVPGSTETRVQVTADSGKGGDVAIDAHEGPQWVDCGRFTLECEWLARVASRHSITSSARTIT
jgi:hypothetical protein